ncbi:MAG: hypothetical protein ACYDFV_04920 [Vulcanimicrobiaceae bacterium]
MKIRLLLGGFAILAAGLVACGGGGGGGGGNIIPSPPPSTTAPPPPPPTSSPAVYSGTLQKNDTYAYPASSPLPSTSANATVTLNVSTGSSANPFGQGGTDQHSVQSDAFPLQTTVETTDSWVNQLSNGQVVLYGFQSADNVTPTPDSLSWQYVSPQTLDELPETNGASWQNSPQATVLETDADGFIAKRAINPDGSYSENDIYPTGFKNTITVNSDGSGSYLGTGWAQYGTNGLTYSAPTNGVITIKLTAPTPVGTATPAPPTVFATPAAWFAPSPTLYSQSTTVTTGVTFPASCAVPATYGTTGNDIDQVTSRIDPVVGFTDNQTIQTYTAPGVGSVCVVMNDGTDYYYDYSQDLGFLTIGINSTPMHVATIAQTLTLQSGPPAIIVARRSAAASGGHPVMLSPETIAVGRARFMAAVEREHAKHVQALRTFFTRYLHKRQLNQGGVR